MGVDLALQRGQLRPLFPQRQLVHPRLVTDVRLRHFGHLVQQDIDFGAEQVDLFVWTDMDSVFQLFIQAVLDKIGDLRQRVGDAAAQMDPPQGHQTAKNNADQHSLEGKWLPFRRND